MSIFFKFIYCIPDSWRFTWNFDVNCRNRPGSWLGWDPGNGIGVSVPDLANPDFSRDFQQ